jgi:hypothetical protein
MKLQPAVPEANSPVGTELNVHEVPFELKPNPPTEITAPKLPLDGVRLIVGTTVN